VWYGVADGACMRVVANASRIALVGEAGSLASRAVSSSRAKSAAASFRSPVSIARTALASSA